MFLQLAVGVLGLHKRLILHRDIKPKNILVSGDSPLNEVLYICDFGISLLLNDDNDTVSDEAGTEGFTAPEVLK